MLTQDSQRDCPVFVPENHVSNTKTVLPIHREYAKVMIFGETSVTFSFSFWNELGRKLKQRNKDNGNKVFHQIHCAVRLGVFSGDKSRKVTTKCTKIYTRTDRQKHTFFKGDETAKPHLFVVN